MTVLLDVYDFDGTIYRGDSSVDFWKYCVGRQLSLLRYFPRQVMAFIGMKLGLLSGEKGKARFFCFLRSVDKPEEAVEAFWRSHGDRLVSWFPPPLNDNKMVVASASPAFLLDSLCRTWGVPLLATEMDVHTGRINGRNCKGEEKLRRLKAWMSPEKEWEIHAAYSDSLKADGPLLRLAAHPYLVRRGRVEPISQEENR